MSDETGRSAPLLVLEVPPALDGERLDRGVALLAGLSRAEASLLVSEGQARLGGAPALVGSRRMRSGEVLEVDLDGARTSHQGAHPSPGARVAEGAAPVARVVYADAGVVVVDKPAGLVVHPGAGHPGATLVQQLVDLFPDILQAGPDPQRPGIVHRLDKGTSGLLVVARAPAAREALGRQMAGHTVERRYLALVHGLVEADEGLIDAPLGRSPSQRVKMAVVHGGRLARTRYWVRARSVTQMPVTLVTCQLETGRTHQIRTHFAAIGHPLVADERYAKPSLLKLSNVVLPGLRRPWLHAAALGFVHPLTGEMMRFLSPLPADLAEALVALNLSPDLAVA